MTDYADLIAKLEAATEGSEALDWEILALFGNPSDDIATCPRHMWTGGAPAGYRPIPFSRSIDAALPGEDICRMVKIEDAKGRTWFEAQQSGGYEWTGKHKYEAIARRIAALKARSAA